MYFVSEDEIIQPRTILAVESRNTDVSSMFINAVAIMCCVVIWSKGSVCILARFICIGKLRPNMSPVGTSTTGSVVLLRQVLRMSRIYQVFFLVFDVQMTVHRDIFL